MGIAAGIGGIFQNEENQSARSAGSINNNGINHLSRKRAISAKQHQA